MKLSTKSRYGVRAMLDLAFHYKYGPVSVGDIAKREDISVHYLEQILNRLKKEGLVKSMRGPKGGYVLSRPPARIKISQIVEVLEGGIAPVNCVSGRKRKRNCERIGKCIAKTLWDRLGEKIKNYLDSVTLADLLKEAREAGIEKGPRHEFTFNI